MPHAAVRDLLAHHAKETFVGRTHELALPARAPEQSIPPRSLRNASGLPSFRTDANWFLVELGAAVGGDTASIQEACDLLGQISRRVVLILDKYEVLRLLDTWLAAGLCSCAAAHRA